MKIAVLCPARPNSALLAHFIISFFNKIKCIRVSTSLRIMMNANDTWNDGVDDVFDDFDITFIREDYRMGRQGLHVYYNELASLEDADWYMLACEDMDFIMDGWDVWMREQLETIDSSKPYVFWPRFDNTGAVCPVVSHGYLKAVNGRLSEHWSVDSWIGHVCKKLHPSTCISPDVKMMTDYTVGGLKWLHAAPVNIVEVITMNDPRMTGLLDAQAEMIRKAQ